MDHRTALGHATELWVCDLLAQEGIAHTHLHNGGEDIRLASGLRLEVKGCTRSADNWYRATLENKHQTLAHADVLVLIAWENKQAYAYVIPASAVNTKRIAVRPGGRGQWEAYRVQADHVVNAILNV